MLIDLRVALIGQPPPKLLRPSALRSELEGAFNDVWLHRATKAARIVWGQPEPPSAVPACTDEVVACPFSKGSLSKVSPC